MTRVASHFVVIAAALALRVNADITDLRGAVFRGLDDAPRIKIVSDDELEFTPERDGPNLVCKYSRDGDSLRVVVTVLGSPQAVYFKFLPEGLQRADGTILYDAAHFDAAAKAAAAERAAALAAITPTPIPAVAISGSTAKSVAIFAPAPEYPYEARRGKITGSGIVVMIIDASSGVVTDASMAPSTGSPILDNAATSAFRRWRFKPGTFKRVRMPISFTMSEVLY